MSNKMMKQEQAQQQAQQQHTTPADIVVEDDDDVQVIESVYVVEDNDDVELSTPIHLPTVSAAVVVAAAAAAPAIEGDDDDENTECMVCYEKFNLSNHKPIVCEFGNCKNKVCRDCIRTYLLNCSTEPHCMACKRSWTPAFLIGLNKNWLKDTYRVHREKLLCDIEISKLPETMEAAERHKEAKREEVILNDMNTKYIELTNQLRELNLKIGQSRNKIAVLKRGGTAATEKKVFFMPCPQVECKGMLSTQYKCGICDLFTCPDCHEIIGLHKTDAHTCDPNNVASALAIKKETRQCPGCQNRIYRIEGCSQMWCTGCHTAFDWNTGKKVIGERLHNPHWVEYQRTIHGEAPRAPGDVVCGGVIGWRDFESKILRKCIQVPNVEFDIKRTIRAIYDVVDNVTRNMLRTTREKVQTLRDFEPERIKYIIGEMTKEELSTHIYRNDRLRQKHTELLHIFELLSAVGIEVFNRLANSTTVYAVNDAFTHEVLEQIAIYDNLRIYCNGLCAIISNTYNLSVPYINEKWYMTLEKFNSKSLSAVGSSGGGGTVAVTPKPKKKVVKKKADITGGAGPAPPAPAAPAAPAQAAQAPAAQAAPAQAAQPQAAQ